MVLDVCRERIAARAQPLHEANVTVEIFPLTKPGDTFGMAFWNRIIHAADDEESGVQYEQGSDTMYRLQVTATCCLVHHISSSSSVQSGVRYQEGCYCIRLQVTATCTLARHINGL